MQLYGIWGFLEMNILIDGPLNFSQVSRPNLWNKNTPNTKTTYGKMYLCLIYLPSYSKTSNKNITKMYWEKPNILTKNIACINYMQFLMLWGWPFYFQTLVTELVIHLETKPFGDVSDKAQLKIVLRKGKKKMY